MKLTKIIASVSVVMISQFGFSQSNILNAKSPDEIGKKTARQLEADNDKPLPYGYVEDRDVLMGKMVWEIIDLDERVNFPLYFPVDTNNVGKDRRSLFSVLISEIKKGRITEVYYDDYFNQKKTLKDMESSFTYIDTIQSGRDEINDNYDAYFPQKRAPKYDKNGKLIPQEEVVARVLDPQYIDKRELSAYEVSGYKIKGMWYFDKRQGEMKYRLLGICPVAPEAREIGVDNPDVIELFWVYFPATRDVLHEWNSFNDRNSAAPLTFDHLLNSRRFNAVIYKEENVYGDRQVAEYMKDNALNQLLESERIKEKIRNFEQDMWNY